MVLNCGCEPQLRWRQGFLTLRNCSCINCIFPQCQGRWSNRDLSRKLEPCCKVIFSFECICIVHRVIRRNSLTYNNCRIFLWFKILICFYGTLIPNSYCIVKDLMSLNWLGNVWIFILIIVWYLTCLNPALYSSLLQ